MDLSGSSRTPIPANQVVSVNPDSAGHRGVLVVSHDHLRQELGWPRARIRVRAPSLGACARRGTAVGMVAGGTLRVILENFLILEAWMAGHHDC